ncbi:hypothetical protein [Schaedlerella arabinosiphila]|jgi:hypothetical protein|nr:hypothetical protein [Schaedlerella arabinosiphila]
MNKIFGYGNYGGAIKAAIVSAILKGNMKPKMHILQQQLFWLS